VFVGLTGGIGCGKSVVNGIFAQFDWLVLDADDICHSIYDSADEEFLELLKRRWGTKIVTRDGAGLDRGKIADIVFNSEKELCWLNSVIHPAVYQKALRIRSAQPGKDAVFDVPLLFEAGWENRFDAVVAVWTDDAIRFRRLRERGMTEEDIVKRDSTQMSCRRKMEMSDVALINNGDIENLRAQCEMLSRALRNGNASQSSSIGFGIG